MMKRIRPDHVFLAVKDPPPLLIGFVYRQHRVVINIDDGKASLFYCFHSFTSVHCGIERIQPTYYTLGYRHIGCAHDTIMAAIHPILHRVRTRCRWSFTSYWISMMEPWSWFRVRKCTEWICCALSSPEQYSNPERRGPILFTTQLKTLFPYKGSRVEEDGMSHSQCHTT